MRKNKKECAEDRVVWAQISSVPLRKWHVGRLAAAVARIVQGAREATLVRCVYDKMGGLESGAAGTGLTTVLCNLRYDVLGALRDEGVELGSLPEGVRWPRIVAAAARSVARRLLAAEAALSGDLTEWVEDMKMREVNLGKGVDKRLVGFQRDDWTALMRKKGLGWGMSRVTATTNKRGDRVGRKARACDSVYERGDIVLSWHVDEVVLNDTSGREVKLGDFQVVLTIGVDSGRVRVAATAEPVHNNEERSGHWHPHVGGDERVCLGDAREAVMAAVEMGMLGGAVALVEGVLRTYNEDNPYVELWRWREEEGECEACGCAMPEDEGYVCDNCSNEVCSECLIGCDCGRLHLCSDCDDDSETKHCASCGRLLCGACEDDGMCACCAQDRENEVDAEVDGAEEEAQDGATVLQDVVEEPMPLGITAALGHVCQVCGAESLADDVCADCGGWFCEADLFPLPRQVVEAGMPLVEVVDGGRRWVCEECRNARVGGWDAQGQGPEGVCAVCGTAWLQNRAASTIVCGTAWLQELRVCVDCGKRVCASHRWTRGDYGARCAECHNAALRREGITDTVVENNPLR